MIKQCVRCKYGHLKATHVPQGYKAEEKWECKKGHEIKNPREITRCKDFEEKPLKILK